MVQLSPTSTASLTDLDHCYRSGVLIGYRTLPILSDVATHKQSKTTVLSTTTSPEHLLSIILSRTPVSPTLFYTQGEPDVERVKAWLRVIDQHYPMNTVGAIYVGTTTTETEMARSFQFQRLKATSLNGQWIQIEEMKSD